MRAAGLTSSFCFLVRFFNRQLKDNTMTNFKALLVISALLSDGVAQAASQAGAPIGKNAMKK